MKKILLPIITIITTLLVSCAKEYPLPSSKDGGDIQLELECSSIRHSRATVNGEDVYNENKLYWINIYGVPLEDNENAPLLFFNWSTQEKSVLENGNTLVTIKNFCFNTDQDEDVFPNYNTGVEKRKYLDKVNKIKFVVICNSYDSTIEEEDELYPYPQAKKKVIKDEFAFEPICHMWESELDKNNNQPSRFVMIGSCIMTKENGKWKRGKVELKRLATKIRVAASIPDNVRYEGKIWNVADDGITVQMIGGVNQTLFGVAYTGEGFNDKNPYKDKYNQEDYKKELPTSDYHFKITQSRKLDKEKGIYIQTIPNYSYPIDWTKNADDEIYMLLSITWKNEKNETFISSYKVPVNGVKTSTEANTYYKINVRVKDLKTLDDVEVNVKDWNKEDINADIMDYRYLVLDEHRIVMNNLDEYNIPFSSSHPCEMEVLSVVHHNTSHDNACWDDETSEFRSKPGFVTLTDLRRGMVRIENHLDNDPNHKSTFDYTPYIFRLKIKQKDMPEEWNDTVYIVQYPAMYILAESNSDFIYKDYGDQEGNNEHMGYVFVNSLQKDVEHGYQYYGGVSGLKGDGNRNPNRYVINVSAFNSNHDFNFLIGDPREVTVDNLGAIKTGSDNTKDPDWYTNRGKLYEDEKDKYFVCHKDDYGKYISNYHKTDEGLRTKNMISPKFRIASSYGVTNRISYMSAKKRCASYQEDGYPAGRWRVPTLAEARYIVRLSAEGKIPTLFSNAYEYWCAHGFFIPKKTNGGEVSFNVEKDEEAKYYVRCVYDVWYWNETTDKEGKCDKETFTWGWSPANLKTRK